MTGPEKEIVMSEEELSGEETQKEELAGVDNSTTGETQAEEQTPITNDTDGAGDQTEGDGDDELVKQFEELKAQNEQLAQSAQAHQAWGTKERQKAARLEKELADLRGQIPRPEILDEIDGLEAGIAHVLRSNTTAPAPGPEPADESQNAFNNWESNVIYVHPDFRELSQDPAFHSRVETMLNGLGPEAMNPIHTIRLVNAIKAETQNAAGPNGQAAKLKKMRVPSGAGRGKGATSSDENKYDKMSLSEIESLAQRVVMRG